MKRKVLITVIMWVFLLVISAGRTKLGASDYYQESLYFDENGNFFMTTHDAIATKSTRYCTLGWTIKRYDLPIDNPLNMCATIIITCDGSVEDPENDRYLYSFFYCDKDAVFNAIGNVSKEWQRELYLNGATVYLDGIMTVIAGEEVLGSLSEDGSRDGEVYDTYEGIVSARNWGVNSKNSLRTHFNKSVYFPAVEGFFSGEESEESSESGSIQLGSQTLEAGIRVSAGSYNPSVAIPSGEKVKINAWQQAYAYEVGYEAVSGEVVCTIPVILTGKKTIVDETGLPKTIDGQIAETTYEVTIPYTYYEINFVKLYYADGIYVSSGAFSKGRYIDTGYEPKVSVVMYEGTEEHVKYEKVAETIQVDIGELTDASEIEACISAEVESVINSKPQIRNDYLSIDGVIIMEDDWVEEAEAPDSSALEPFEINESVNITIPVMTQNDTYSVTAKVYYDYMVFGDADAEYITDTIKKRNAINVHTPVVCKGNVSDVKEWNQAAFPSANTSSLVLNRDFFVEVSNQGEHIGAKGYGENDYEKYILCNQVKFPFEVINSEGEILSANTWLTIEGRSEFILPVTVIEGEYKVEYRTIAYNFNEDYTDYERMEERANLSADNYIATDFVMVEVVGQLYGFELTEIIEYKSITHPESLMGVCGADKLPLIWREKGLPLGSYFRFSLKSIGSYADGARVTIVPSFWYMEGTALKEVDIYYETVRADNRSVLKKWSTAEHRLELTKDNRVLSETEGVYGSDGRCQMWSGIYMLPMKSYCLPKGASLSEHGVDSEDFLEVGQVLVRFDIRIEDKNGKNILLYINGENAKAGYCNRWEKEGGKDGRVIIYNTGESVKDSMRITGTH